jgi:uncharacterized protein (TIGR03437 family)
VGLDPYDVAVDNGGNVYVADRGNHRIRKINLSTKVIATVAGSGVAGYAGNGGAATSAQLRAPTGVAVDAGGNIYIADWGNNFVRMVRGTTISTIAGTGNFAFDVEAGPATGVSVDPLRVAVSNDGGIYVVDQSNDRIRKLTLAVPSSLTISSGDGQSGPPGGQVRISVKITDGAGIPLAGVTVNFSVASGSAQLSSAVAQTAADGTASVRITLGPGAGPVRILAVSAGLQSVTFNLAVTLAPAATTAPQISDGGVVGAALSFPAMKALSSGGIASVFGKNFGGGATCQKVSSSDLVNGRVPTNFKGICVDLGGTRAPVFGASGTQVNFQVVPLTAGGTVAVRVIAGCGTAAEIASSPVTVAVQAATAEFFYYAYNSDGRNPVAATDSVTNAGTAALDLYPGSGFSPAHSRQYVTVYATGFGTTNPSFAAGEFPAQLAAAVGPVRVLLNGRELGAANVLYAGVTPFSPGLYQINLLLPDDTPDGDLSLVIEIAGVRSPAGAYLTVKN